MASLLIDGDEFVYHVSSVLERPIDWGDGIWTMHADQHEGEVTLEHMIESLVTSLEADGVVIALSGNDPGRFRKDIYEGYKSHRKDGRKPMIYWPLVEFLKNTYKFVQEDGLEADDIMGIVATSNPGKFILVSSDKDMLQIPGYLYRPHKADEGILEITEEQADRHHLFQTLVGDRADGYPGCPGIGDVRANRLLDEECSWANVVKAYNLAKLTEEDALVQARVARILRKTEWDKKRRKVKLWNPEKPKSKTKRKPAAKPKTNLPLLMA